MIKSINDNQTNLIKDIISLYCPNGFDLDPTYSKGNFYKNVEKPKYKSDLFPQSSDVIQSDAANLWLKMKVFNLSCLTLHLLQGIQKKSQQVSLAKGSTGLDIFQTFGNGMINA